MLMREKLQHLAQRALKKRQEKDGPVVNPLELFCLELESAPPLGARRFKD